MFCSSVLSCFKCCFPCCFSQPPVSPPTSPAAVAVVSPSAPDTLKGRISSSSHEGSTSTFISLHPVSGPALASVDVAMRATYRPAGGIPLSAISYPPRRSEGPGEHSAVGRPPSPPRRLGAGAGGAAGISRSASGLEMEHLTLDLSGSYDPKKMRAAGQAALLLYRERDDIPDFRDPAPRAAAGRNVQGKPILVVAKKAVEEVARHERRDKEAVDPMVATLPNFFPTPAASYRRIEESTLSEEGLPSPGRLALIREVNDRLLNLAPSGLSPRAAHVSEELGSEKTEGKDPVSDVAAAADPSEAAIGSSRARRTSIVEWLDDGEGENPESPFDTLVGMPEGAAAGPLGAPTAASARKLRRESFLSLVNNRSLA